MKETTSVTSELGSDTNSLPPTNIDPDSADDERVSVCTWTEDSFAPAADYVPPSNYSESVATESDFDFSSGSKVIPNGVAQMANNAPTVISHEREELSHPAKPPVSNPKRKMPYKPYITQVKNPDFSGITEQKSDNKQFVDCHQESEEIHERKPSSVSQSDSGFESTKAMDAPPIPPVPGKSAPAPPPRKPKGINITSLRERSRSVSPQKSGYMSRAGSNREARMFSPPLGRSRTPSMKDDDELSITSRDSATAVRKISKTGPGKAWYRGYMTNFKGEGSEFAPVSGRNTPQEATPRNSKEALHSSQKSVQGRELPRPQSASEMRNVFINNSLDEIQSREVHESQHPQVVPRRKSNYRHMKRIFRDNSLDQISSRNRASLHESMVNLKPEISGSIENAEHLAANVEQLEVHDSQKTPKPRRSGPLRSLRDKFAKQTLEDISKECRSTLHESMIPQQVPRLPDRTSLEQDHPEHTQLHESQRVNTMRKKKPKNFDHIRNLFATSNEEALRGEREGTRFAIKIQK